MQTTASGQRYERVHTFGFLSDDGRAHHTMPPIWRFLQDPMAWFLDLELTILEVTSDRILWNRILDLNDNTTKNLELFFVK